MSVGFSHTSRSRNIFRSSSSVFSDAAMKACWSNDSQKHRFASLSVGAHSQRSFLPKRSPNLHVPDACHITCSCAPSDRHTPRKLVLHEQAASFRCCYDVSSAESLPGCECKRALIRSRLASSTEQPVLTFTQGTVMSTTQHQDRKRAARFRAKAVLCMAVATGAIEGNWGSLVVRVVQDGCLLVRIGVVGAIVAGPAVGPVRSQAGHDTGQALAIAVGDEVVGVAVRHTLVLLLHGDAVDVVHSHLEQCDLPGGFHDALSLWQRLIVGKHNRVVLHRSRDVRKCMRQAETQLIAQRPLASERSLSGPCSARVSTATAHNVQARCSAIRCGPHLPGTGRV